MNSRKRNKPTIIAVRAKLVSWRDKVEIIVQDMYGQVDVLVAVMLIQ